MEQDPEGVSEAPDRWLTRPFASTFDLILHEYPGYTDDTLLDVTLGRLHQMRDMILERKKEEDHAHLMVVEAELQHICSAVYASVGSKDGVKAASRIQLFERPKKLVVATEAQLMRMFSGG